MHIKLYTIAEKNKNTKGNKNEKSMQNVSWEIA